jgi:hypothetical protein
VFIGGGRQRARPALLTGVSLCPSVGLPLSSRAVLQVSEVFVEKAIAPVEDISFDRPVCSNPTEATGEEFAWPAVIRPYRQLRRLLCFPSVARRRGERG